MTTEGNFMKKRELIFIVILAGILFTLYWRTFNYELIWDDKTYFRQNMLFTENPPLSSAFKISYFGRQIGMEKIDFYYRPLLTASFMIENKLGGIKTARLRLINLLIYFLSLIFLYIFFKKQKENAFFPEIATLLFALYPLNMDNIIWIVGRSDLLVLLWGSLAFLFLEFFIKKGKPIYGVGSSFFYLLGILSKESFFFFLPIFLVYEIIKRKKIAFPFYLVNILITISFFILKNAVIGTKNLRFILPSNLTEIILTIIGAAGFYFRAIIFPFSHNFFLPPDDVRKFIYLLFGILFISLFLFIGAKYKKDKEILLPLSFIAAFLGGLTPLVFSTLYPFAVYPRYMMIPGLGFIWILSKYLCQIKEKIRSYLVLILILLFIPSIIINSNSYKTEVNFWQKAYRSSPQNAYILFQLAGTFQEKRDYLSSEFYLNKTLSLNLKRETAILISLLYANIEIAKADYAKVFKWLNAIEEFEKLPNVQLAPYIKSQVNQKKAQVYICLGNKDEAEKLLRENMNKYKNFRDSYLELYNLYLGSEMWDKAKELEAHMKNIFPSVFRERNADQRKAEFSSLSVDKKISFYIRYRNYSKASILVKSMIPLDLSYEILLARLSYLEGKEEQGQKIVNDILIENPDKFEMLNTIGYFYLNDLFRVKEALIYFKKSLNVNSNQPGLSLLINRLTNDYLSQLKETWK